MSMDHYMKLRVIGKGSYGEVWLVKHKRDKKQYVLKKMEMNNASKRERKAAEQEAKLLSKLRHPNICSYKDSFETTEGFLYIAMGYCEGGDLYNKLKEQKGTPLEERQVVEWFVQIAMALQYMHERNILHRDLKTQNIFLTKSKIIKVGDLGIARVLDSSSDMATTLIGTPYYMSPELFSNKPYNHKSDVWALGCCVYEMATLKHAFNAKDMNSLVYKILRGRMPNMPKEYSPELVALIRAMLNQNPDKRPSVNRILRDPYIKKNIAIFLEGTKKSRRPSSGRVSSGEPVRRSSRSSVTSESDLLDGPESSRSSVSSASRNHHDRSRFPGGEERLEPLHIAPGLEPIQEAPDNMSSSGGSNRATPVHSRPATPSKDRLASRNEESAVRQLARRKKKRHKSDPEIQVVVDVDTIEDPLPPAKSKNTVMEKPKPVEKPRPLPPRPNSASNPPTSAATPRKSRSSRDREESSGYASSSVGSSANSSRDDHSPSQQRRQHQQQQQQPREELPPEETPRGMNLSARARRREKKESETPRTARSVDLDRGRRHSDVSDNPKAAEKVRQSADPVLERQKPPKPQPDYRDRVVRPLEKPRTRVVKQPSVHDSSSSDSEPETPNGEKQVEREKRRNDKEMNNFISLLDTTLHMNKDEDKSDDERDAVDNKPLFVKKPEPNPILVPVQESSGQIEDLEDEDDDDICIPPRRAKQQIIETIGGKTLSASGRLLDRINILRKDCIRGLGVEKLKRAYDILDNIDGDELEPQLVRLLGRDDFDLYAGKIWQLKFCEESAFGLN